MPASDTKTKGVN